MMKYVLIYQTVCYGDYDFYYEEFKTIDELEIFINEQNETFDGDNEFMVLKIYQIVDEFHVKAVEKTIKYKVDL